MRIAKVVGNVVSTIKDKSYYGYKLMIIEYLDENCNPDGNRLIVFDAAQSGIGDIVLVDCDGGAANMLFDDKELVADVTICGVLEQFTFDGNTTFIR